MTERLPQGDRMQDWAAAVRRAGNRRLAERLGHDKVESWQTLETLGLPHFRSVTLPLVTFLDNPEQYFTGIGSERYFVSLPSTNPTYQRFRQIDLSSTEAMDFVNEHIPAEHVPSYNVHLSEYVENQYGGNIVVAKDGHAVRAEMGTGVQGPIATGAKTPEFIARRDPFTGFFKYDFDDVLVRTAMWRTISAIPNDCSENDMPLGRDTRFKPGYYEFVLIQRGENKPLEPIFLDFSDNAIYQLPT